MKRIKNGLLDMMNISNNDYEKVKHQLYQEIKVDKLLFKPEFEIIKTDIFGLSFASIKNSPNVYVVKTNDKINSEFIKFEHNNLLYTLDNVHVHTVGDKDFIYLECKHWIEEIIE
jgi:hypothetical protein